MFGSTPFPYLHLPYAAFFRPGMALEQTAQLLGVTRSDLYDDAADSPYPSIVHGKEIYAQGARSSRFARVNTRP